ncbi:MAG TPA: recombinase RecT [Xanthobacteraceae bacterium]|nr:recombinase RecT [Xanthobacteraceae bacterium]
MAFDVAKIQDRIDLTAASGVVVSDETGGIRFQNMLEVLEFSKMMAVADTAVPKHLRGNPGMCLAVCVQALEWRFSPFAVANKSYVVNDRIGYESQLVHAVIEQRAPITGRLRHKFDGEGDDRRCIVTATLRETGETLEYVSPPISKINPKNSPLWKTKPDLQLYYNTSRDFCRAYFPDVLLGVYSQDELRDHVGPDNAKDVTAKPDVGSRLKGNKGRGFSAQHVERETRGVVDQAASEPATETSEDAASNTVDAGATQDSEQPVAPTNQESSGPDTGDEGQAGDGTASVAGLLPEGWERSYADALRQAAKKDSLEKLGKRFWADHSTTWEQVRETEHANTASAIFSAFWDHFGKPEALDAVLRELGAA